MGKPEKVYVIWFDYAQGFGLGAMKYKAFYDEDEAAEYCSEVGGCTADISDIKGFRDELNHIVRTHKKDTREPLYTD